MKQIANAQADSSTLARITQVATREGDDAFWLVHPASYVLDICEFNAIEGTSYEPVPAAFEQGVALNADIQPDHILLDQALLGQRALHVWNGAEFEAVELKALSGGHVVTACFPPAIISEYGSDREQINSAVTQFTGQRIQQRLDETLDIPPLPEAAQRIVALQSDPNFDLAELVTVVETDPAIAAKVMSWANSAFYAANPPARSLDDAIMRILGFDLVMNLALGLVLSGTLRLPESTVSGAAPVWLRSVFTATAMEAICRKLPVKDGPSPGSCYLTGLLSNFGTLVLGHVFPPHYRTICRLQEANPHLPTNIIDEYVLRLSREVIGATLLEQWDLPDEIVTAIRHQNTENYTGAHPTWVNMLRVANQMLSQDLTTTPNRVELGGLEVLGLEEPDLNSVSELLQNSQADLEGLARAVA